MLIWDLKVSVNEVTSFEGCEISPTRRNNCVLFFAVALLYMFRATYSWWVRLSPETCRVKPLRRIKRNCCILLDLFHNYKEWCTEPQILNSFEGFCLFVYLCMFVCLFPTLVWEWNEIYGRIRKFLNFCLCQLTGRCDGFYYTLS